MDIHVRTATDPAIVDCTDVNFRPFVVAGISSLPSSIQKIAESETWRNIQDFSCLNDSPNWKIIS